MTFKEFVAQTKIHADGAGDVLRLVRQDLRPPEIATLRGLQAYLRSRGLNDSLAQYAPLAWTRYVGTQSKPAAGTDH